MKGQTRKHSFIESAINIVIGYGVAVGVQSVVFPLFDIRITAEQNLMIGAIFTVVSLIRSYCLRRIFNRITIGWK